MGGRAVIFDDEDENEIAEEEEDERGVEDAEVVQERDDDDGDEDEEEEEGQDQYEDDGFIVDDVDEEGEPDEEEDDRESDEEEKHKKKKRRKRESEKNYVLDDDDYELLQDNNITGFHRPKLGSKKFKRLKKAGRDTEQERSGFSDEEEVDIGGRSGQTDEEKLKHKLFGDDEGAALEDIPEEEEQPEEEDGDIGEDDEMADFIVDEEEVDENGALVRRRKASKKKSRQAPGVSSSALQEAQDIFGDVDDLLMRRKQGLEKAGSYSEPGEWREKRLEDEFEPSIIAEKYMTQKDDQIREIDVPERIQLFEEVTGPVPTDDTSLEEESQWIYRQLISPDSSPFFGNIDLVREINREDIGRVLGMLHVQKWDIPFIATYRKELCLTLLKDPECDLTEGEDKTERMPKLKWHKKLWAVQNLDKKWLLLQKRKTALESYYNKRFQEEARRIDDETRLALNRQLFNSVLESLKLAESEREVDDVDAKFNLHFPPGEVELEEGQFKRPKRKSLYSICSKAGLWEVSNKFGFSSEQFGLLLNLEKMRVDELEDAKETPEEIAANFTCAMFESPQDVLKGARHMAAVEISCEPSVRRHVRSIYMEKAVVYTSPTPDGKTAIDYFHRFAAIKWLDKKPLCEFKDAQWLLIQKAEEEKLIQVTIKLPENVQTKLINDSNDYYISDGVSKSAQLWNEQRKLILKDAFFSFLFPSMEKEARFLLTARAKNLLLMEYGKQLWNRVSVAPYQRKDNDASSEDDAAPRVMACCWGPGKPATTFVMLDSSGEMLDVLYTGSLNIRSQGEQQQRKKNDQQRLLKFMTDHQPHVVILGAANLSCKRLKDDIFEVIFKIVEEHPREVGQEFAVSVVYGDESLPHLYENSRISSDQLTGQPGIVKRAVALGRYLQNPLAMIATLCGPGREILSWKLHTLEHFLTPDEKHEMVERIMIDATNQVGVDINLAASHEWLFSPLQFVSGLGPRKASALQKALVMSGAIFIRKELLMNGFLRKKVFINAAGFLRVRRSGLATTSSHFIDLLDDTRIHPESYELAKRMAKDVYDEDVQDPNEMDDDAQEMAIEHVREKPKLLKALDIDEYAMSLEEQVGEKKRETLMDIKMELLNGFQELRTPYSEPSQDEEFYMLSGETEETIEEGRCIQVTVRRVTDPRIICVLDSGLTGVISRDDLPKFPIDNLTEGSILTCKIKGVQKNRLQVILGLAGLKNEDAERMKENQEDDDIKKKRKKIETLEKFYKEPEKNEPENDNDTVNKKDAREHFKPRMIVHPKFQNWTAEEAMEFLSDKDIGESIFRPSSNGHNYLTLTLKIYDGVYAQKNIAEEGKDQKDITSLLRIGKTLKIDNDTYEDLDEVMDRYVDPLVSNLKAMLGYRKFKKGTKAEVDDLLRMEKSEYPARIVYAFGICHGDPLNIILTYIQSTNPHHEYIKLFPKGFELRGRMFDSIDRLVLYFQKNINNLQLPIKALASKVPFKNPMDGISSPGGSMASGWSRSPVNSSDGGWRGQLNSDGDRSSTPGSRKGRNDLRNGGGRSGHPSGLPRPSGRGHGYHPVRGSHHSRSQEHDSGYGSSEWGSGKKDEDNELSSFPGAKVQNSPGKEFFPGGWGNNRSGSGWSNGGLNNPAGSNNGWGSSSGGGNWSGGNGDGGSGWG